LRVTDDLGAITRGGSNLDAKDGEL